MASDESGLREAILQAGLELGTEMGEEGLTMRAIARRLNVSATALYQHFDSKAAILRAIRFRGIQQLNAYLRPAFSLDDPRDRLREQGRLYIRFARENPWLYCLLMVDDPEDWSTLQRQDFESLMEGNSLVQQAIVEGKARGIFREELAPGPTAFMVWSGLHGVSLLILRGRISEHHPQFPIESLDNIMARFVNALVTGLEKDAS